MKYSGNFNIPSLEFSMIIDLIYPIGSIYMTVSDTKDNLIETKDGITCGCGNPKLKMTCHIDGVDFYSYQYNCKCGNSIAVNYKRKKGECW